MKQKLRSNSGFTIIEIGTVTSIILCITAFGVWTIKTVSTRNDQTATQTASAQKEIHQLIVQAKRDYLQKSGREDLPPDNHTRFLAIQDHLVLNGKTPENFEQVLQTVQAKEIHIGDKNKYPVIISKFDPPKTKKGDPPAGESSGPQSSSIQTSF